MHGAKLSVSIVEYFSAPDILVETMRRLESAVFFARTSAILYVINNRPNQSLSLPDLQSDVFMELRVKSGQGNVGFGRGHNIAISEVVSEYHLILNPDAFLEVDAIEKAIAFLDEHPDVGLVVPDALAPNGNRQYLCKRYPTLLDLMLRGFAPAVLRRLFRKRLNRYEMQDVVGSDILLDPPIVSGCCMLFRTDVLKKLNGFDPRYFLYFEDFDLSLRTARVTHIAYLPSMKIIHYGGYAARKGWRHVYLFMRSAMTFFRTYGWKFW